MHTNLLEQISFVLHLRRSLYTASSSQTSRVKTSRTLVQNPQTAIKVFNQINPYVTGNTQHYLDISGNSQNSFSLLFTLTTGSGIIITENYLPVIPRFLRNVFLGSAINNTLVIENVFLQGIFIVEIYLVIFK